jgi:Cys-rich protein (TIGR01571 family)
MADKKYVSSQPLGTSSMVAGGDKNANNYPIGADGKRNWSFGLFDCFNSCGLCCQAVWCPCVVYSKNRQRLHHLQEHGSALPGGGETYNGPCYIYGGLLLLSARYVWTKHARSRVEVRERYGIRGNKCGDRLTVMCCGPCAHTQERREIELEEGSF